MTVTQEQIAEMVAMRKRGLSFGDISKHYNQKYPAWSRHYILKAAPETSTISARRVRAVAKVTPLHSQLHDMDIEIVHGNGNDYGCGKVIGTVKMLDSKAPDETRELIREHKLHCNVLTEKGGRDDSSVRPVKVARTGKLSGAHSMRKVGDSR